MTHQLRCHGALQATVAAARGLLLVAAILLPTRALAAPLPQASDLELRCINRAGSLTELEGCERSRYGQGMSGMGGWGSPRW